VGRGIRVGLERCTVCGTAHERPGRLCDPCSLAVRSADRAALVARNIEYLSGRFGSFVTKDPEWYRSVAAQSIERRFFA
jgi:hypothetical protein